jgi:hypothetical protein
MSECHDFVNEETALQVLGGKLGLLVDRTPKFHTELAGEGIEYSWACSKAVFRRLTVAARKGRDNFKLQVRNCTDPTTTLDRKRVCWFSATLREQEHTYAPLIGWQRSRKSSSNKILLTRRRTTTHLLLPATASFFRNREAHERFQRTTMRSGH